MAAQQSVCIDCAKRATYLIRGRLVGNGAAVACIPVQDMREIVVMGSVGGGLLIGSVL